MSLTCQLVPEPVTVIAYCVLPLVVPFELTRCCLAVTMNVRLDGPKARSELITAVPVDTCFWLVRAGHPGRARTGPAAWWPAAR